MFPLTPVGESCAFSFSSNKPSPSSDQPFLFTWIWVLAALGCCRGERGKKCQNHSSGYWLLNWKHIPCNTSKRARKKKVSLDMFHPSRQFFFLGYKNLSFQLFNKNKSQSVIVKMSGGKCNSLTRNYMSYLSPPKLLLQERAGGMHCIWTCFCCVGQEYFSMALQQLPPLHRSWREMPTLGCLLVFIHSCSTRACYSRWSRNEASEAELEVCGWPPDCRQN